MKYTITTVVLVEMCYSIIQVMGIDYERTFSPITRLKTVHLILAIAARWCRTIYQMDIVGDSFHNADLDASGL